MSDSTNPLDQVSQSAIARETKINDNFDAASPAMNYGRRASTTSGLTWGYYGGRWGGFSISNGTTTLTDNATTYMVVTIASGAVSFSTSNTNWNNTSTYARAYKLVAASGVVTYEDHRAGQYGTVAGGAGATFTGGTLTSPINYAPTDTIASATTTDIGASDSNYISITGTTTITGLGTIAAGALRYVTFAGALTFTHNATSLILPGGANITTAAGDSAVLVSLGSGNWKCVGFIKANGKAVVESNPSAPPKVIQVACSDTTTDITTGTAKVTFRMPYAMTLTAVRASLNTVSSSGAPAIDINKTGVGSLLSTVITIDASEKTSTTAATPAVISTSALSDDDEITIDIDTAGTGAKGLVVTLIGT
jgi:hypothetical protein